MDILEVVGNEGIKKEVTQFKAGDTIKVHFNIREGERTRLQVFQGIVIQKRGSGINKTFTLRKISHGVAVERIFPLYSPLIEEIEMVRRARVRRAKLFYLRKLKGRSTKVKRAKPQGIKEQNKEKAKISNSTTS
jgi:large subunit ribosomal protein L19